MPKQKSKVKKQINGRRRIGNGFFSYRKSSYQKNLDNLRLLFSYPDFQKELIVTRKFLEIPPKVYWRAPKKLKNGMTV